MQLISKFMSRHFHNLSVLFKSHYIWQECYTRFLTLKVLSRIIKNSCADNRVNTCNDVYKNLVKNLAGWNWEVQSNNKEPILAAKEKWSSFMRVSDVLPQILIKTFITTVWTDWHLLFKLRGDCHDVFIEKILNKEKRSWSNYIVRHFVSFSCLDSNLNE